MAGDCAALGCEEGGGSVFVVSAVTRGAARLAFRQELMQAGRKEVLFTVGVAFFVVVIVEVVLGGHCTETG